MKITCTLCEQKEEIDHQSFTAKRIRNRPLSTYLCEQCHKRISQKTEQRRQEGRLRPSLFHVGKDGW